MLPKIELAVRDDDTGDVVDVRAAAGPEPRDLALIGRSIRASVPRRAPAPLPADVSIGLTVSPDGSQLWYAGPTAPDADIVLLDFLRQD